MLTARLRELLVAAEEAHKAFEEANGEHVDWQGFYAEYIAKRLDCGGIAKGF